MRKAVIFDVDGTLIDSVDQHALAWRDAFAEFGHSIELSAIRGQIGKGGDQLMPVFLSRTDLADQGAALEKRRGEIFKARYLPTVSAFPAVRALFLRLRDDGTVVALASSAKADELAVYKKMAAVGDLVVADASSGNAERSKPFPDIFQAALDRLDGVAAADAVVIGDTPYDVEAARGAGLRCIGVLSGGFAEADLRRAGCIAIYRDPADLLERYEAWAGQAS
jgi:HAD superfamily hydrolase (TIGR01509 family)